MPVDRVDRPPAEQGERRKQRSDGDECRTGTERGDDERGDERAGGDAYQHHGVQDSEDAADDVLWGGALQQRGPGDVDQGASDPHRDHERERDAEGAGRCEQHEREAEDDEADPEIARQPSPCRENDADEPAEEAADAERSVQPAHPRVARLEQLDRVDHHDHLERAGDEHLGADEADDELGRTALADRPEAREELGPDRAVGRCLRGLVVREPEDEVRRPEIRHRRECEDEPRACEGEEDAADCRPCEHPHARDRVQGEVGSGELLGRAREGGKKGGLGGIEGARDDRSEDGERVGRDRRAAGERDNRDAGDDRRA